MHKIYRNIFLLVALLMSVSVGAQNMTSSPFSRYAYGDMNENVPTACATTKPSTPLNRRPILLVTVLPLCSI